MTKYQALKEKAREIAIDWQNKISQKKMYWSDLAIETEKFTKLGRRYGLIREFRENGII